MTEVAPPTTAPTEPADPLEAFREEMAGTPYVFAVAYMGDTYADEKDYSALLQELSPSVCQKYPFLSDITDRVQPPTDKGRRLKIYYMTQTTTNPPTFALFCNSAELFHYSYQRYIENCLRKTFGFEGTPIRLVIKQKGD